MKRRSMGASIETSQVGAKGDDGRGVDKEAFREALARWAAGVCIVAVRDEDGGVHGTTVSSFGSVSADPPRIMFSLGAGAQVLPFLNEGAELFVNVLAREQRRLASVFADPFPVGPPPFPQTGAPAIPGIHVGLGCRVEQVVEVGNSRLIVARVESTRTDPERSPLLYYMRDFRRLADED